MKLSTIRLILAAIILMQAAWGWGQNSTELMELARIKNNVHSKRVSSYDKTGGNGDCLGGIKDGEKINIMDVKGAGIITHIWITIAPPPPTLSRNDIILRIYWDGNPSPSVE